MNAKLWSLTTEKNTARARMQRAIERQAVASTQQVLGVVAHEMRTPLATLRAVSKLLFTSEGSAEQRAIWAGMIHGEVLKLSDMVDELFEAACRGGEGSDWSWSRVRLKQIAMQAVESVRPLVDEGRVRIGFEIDPADAEVNGDSRAIERLILNLLSNAAKHTSDGSIELSIRIEAARSAEPWVEIIVRDTGEGISAKGLAQLGQGHSLKHGGMGLPLCRGIAQAHGGTISLDSRPGVGTTVKARLRADLHQSAVSRGKMELCEGAYEPHPAG